MTRAEYVRRLVDQAPPLTAHQQHVIRTLLGPELRGRTQQRAAA